jgi:serine/threonine protein kinase
MDICGLVDDDGDGDDPLELSRTGRRHSARRRTVRPAERSMAPAAGDMGAVERALADRPPAALVSIIIGMLRDRTKHHAHSEHPPARMVPRKSVPFAPDEAMKQVELALQEKQAVEDDLEASAMRDARQAAAFDLALTSSFDRPVLNRCTTNPPRASAAVVAPPAKEGRRHLEGVGGPSRLLSKTVEGGLLAASDAASDAPDGFVASDGDLNARSGGGTPVPRVVSARAPPRSQRKSGGVSRSAQMTVDDDGNDVVNDYTLWQELGRGAAGVVFLAIDESANDTKAVKVIPRACAAEVGGLLTEVAIMKQLRHPHIVELFECIDDPVEESVYLVMQYVPDGPMCRLSEDGTCAPLPLQSALHYGKQLTSALHFMHANGVIHGDIKPDNILVDHGLRKGYFADFGVSHTFRRQLLRAGSGCSDGSRQDSGASLLSCSVLSRQSLFCGGTASSDRAASLERASLGVAPSPRHIGNTIRLSLMSTGSATATRVSCFAGDAGSGDVGARHMDPFCAAWDQQRKRSSSPRSGMGLSGPVRTGLGTPAFLAPEIFSGGPPSYAGDMWAFGVTLYVLVFGRVPFRGATYLAVKRAVLHDELSFPLAVPATAPLADLVRQLLVKDPALRLTASELSMTILGDMCRASSPSDLLNVSAPVALVARVLAPCPSVAELFDPVPHGTNGPNLPSSFC